MSTRFPPEGARSGSPPGKSLSGLRDVTVGIIAALPVEGAAMGALITDLTLVRLDDDPNDYRIGYLPSTDRTRPHRVVLTTLPQDNTRSAAAICTDLIRTFVGVRCVIMTGIAGGIPAPARPARHVRLGDVVVALDGIVDYGHVAIIDGRRELRRFVDGISIDLVRAARELQQRAYHASLPWSTWFTPSRSLPISVFGRPPDDTDRLFIGGEPYAHPDPAASGHSPGLPKVHHGRVGCADVLLRDERHRDELAAEHGIVAVEMEGTGVAAGATLHGIGWFMVRGVADYCENRGKNDRWHAYASLAAAAYVRGLLEVCRPFPIPVWRTAPSNGAVALLPDRDGDAIDDLLAEVPELDLRELWAASVGNLVPMPAAAPRDVRDLFAHLAGVNAGPDGLPPSLALVETVSHQVPAPLGGRLRAWAEEAADRLDLSGPLAGFRGRAAEAGAESRPDPSASRGRPVEAPPSIVDTERPCLVIQIMPDTIDTRLFLLRYWIQFRRGPWHPEPGEEMAPTPLAQAERVVEEAVRRAEGAWRESTGAVAIEFLLPTELLSLAVEWWRTELDSSAPTPLCLDYAVAVRSLDRMHAPHRRRAWVNRWNALWVEPPGHRVYWGRSIAAAPDMPAWAAVLRGDASLTCVVLSAPPTADDGRAELDLALRAGVPVIVWDRRGPLSEEGVRLISSIAAGPPNQLAESVGRLRASAALLGDDARQAHPGRHLALLWDDPYRSIEPRRPTP